MRKSLLLHRLFVSLGVFLLAAPVFMLLGAGLSPAFPAAWLPCLAFSLLLAFFVRLLPGKLRLPGIFLLTAASAALTFFWGRRVGAGLPGAVIMAVPASAAVGIHALILSRPWWREMPASIVYLGVMEYLVTRIVSVITKLPQMASPLRSCMLAFLCYAIVFMVLQSLWDGMGSDRAPSRLMKMRNFGAALGMVALFLILTHLQELKDALTKALIALRDGFFWLLSHLPVPGGSGSGQGGMEGGAMGMLPIEEAEPSAFAVFMEKVAYAVCIILTAIAAYFFVRLAGKTLMRALRRLIAKWRAYTNAVTDAYEDTVESLLDWGEVRRAYRERREKARAGREKQTPWEKLPPRQQVRRSYQDFLRRHPEVAPHQTARQALSIPRPAEIYEKARYSSRGVSPEEAREMRRLTDSSGSAARR